MTTIYLIRHAEAEGNLYRIFQGHKDVMLTERGELQVRALAERFREIPVDAVYSSDLYRAAATAAGICRIHGLPLHRTAALREQFVGRWEGHPLGEVARTDPEQMHYFRKDLAKWNLPGAESVDQVRERVMNTLRDIAARHAGQMVAVVSHGAAIRYVLGAVRGDDLDTISRTHTGENTGVAVLTAENGVFRIAAEEDASHLDRWMEKLEGRPYHKSRSGLQVGLWYRTPTAEERVRWLRDAGADASAFGEDAIVRLAMRDEDPVGVLAMRRECGAEQAQGWIDVLWICPEERGKTYGTQLLGQAVCTAREWGRETLMATVTEENIGGRAFLEKRNFGCRNAECSGIVMEKNIALRPLKLPEGSD